MSGWEPARWDWKWLWFIRVGTQTVTVGCTMKSTNTDGKVGKLHRTEQQIPQVSTWRQWSPRSSFSHEISLSCCMQRGYVKVELYGCWSCMEIIRGSIISDEPHVSNDDDMKTTPPPTKSPGDALIDGINVEGDFVAISLWSDMSGIRVCCGYKIRKVSRLGHCCWKCLFVICGYSKCMRENPVKRPPHVLVGRVIWILYIQLWSAHQELLGVLSGKSMSGLTETC